MQELILSKGYNSASINQMFTGKMDIQVELTFITGIEIKITPESLGDLTFDYDDGVQLILKPSQYKITSVTETGYAECVEDFCGVPEAMNRNRKFVGVYIQFTNDYVFGADTALEYKSQEWFDAACEKHSHQYSFFKQPVPSFKNITMYDLDVEDHDTVSFTHEPLGEFMHEATFTLATEHLAQDLTVKYLAGRDDQAELGKMLIADSLIQVGATTKDQTVNLTSKLALKNLEIN